MKKYLLFSIAFFLLSCTTVDVTQLYDKVNPIIYWQSPKEESVCSETTLLVFQVIDDIEVEEVKVYVDSILIKKIWKQVNSKCIIEWDTRKFTNESHNINVRASDTSRNTSEFIIKLYVKN